jgi:putative transcriptional regulator
VTPTKGGSGRRGQLRGALCTLLLVLSVGCPVFAGDANSMTAILLVARGELTDPDFADSIVLVMNNLGPAPVGIIVNRPTKVEVSELASKLFPNLSGLAQLHDKVYFGGPVEFGTVWFLFRAPTQPENAVRAFDGVYVSADKKLLLSLLGRAKPTEGLRIFIGHSGWAPGQLEGEIDRGDWTLKRADPDAIFNGKSEHTWPSPAPSPKASA